jgi:predicted enzyme related to lactoylglutathione lyase
MASTSPRPLAHLELHTTDLEGASAFYSDLLGWRPELIEAAGRSYLSLDLGSRLSGGIVECGTERALWLPYVAVPEVDSATERAELLGGEVMLAPREGPAGWRSVVRAPDGGEVAFWQPKASVPLEGPTRRPRRSGSRPAAR